jgi:hypothetical protein
VRIKLDDYDLVAMPFVALLCSFGALSGRPETLLELIEGFSFFAVIAALIWIGIKKA